MQIIATKLQVINVLLFSTNSVLIQSSYQRGGANSGGVSFNNFNNPSVLEPTDNNVRCGVKVVIECCHPPIPNIFHHWHFTLTVPALPSHQLGAASQPLQHINAENSSSFSCREVFVWPVKQSVRSRVFCDGPSMFFFHFLDVQKNDLLKAKTGLIRVWKISNSSGKTS